MKYLTIGAGGTNLRILGALNPSASTSMHRDFAQGKELEADGLVFDVLRLGMRYKIAMPNYARIAARLVMYPD